MANPIWSDTYLNQLLVDAGSDVVSRIDTCFFHRFYLATTAGTSVYTLPEKVMGVKRVTWRGIELDPLSWQDMEAMAPGLAFVDGGTKIEGSQSRPLFYSLHPTNILDIKFYPCPSESFIATGGDPYAPQANEARCTISCKRAFDDTDVTSSLPTYVDRRTRKAFVLWRAFSKEGKGQNSRAAAYYSNRYTFLIEAFKKINSGAFASTRYQIDDGLPPRGLRPAKPTLGPQFERVRF